jgi:hypothetical protein
LWLSDQHFSETRASVGQPKELTSVEKVKIAGAGDVLAKTGSVLQIVGKAPLLS